MKHIFCSVLLICAMSLGLRDLAAQSVNSKMDSMRALLTDHVELALTCPQGFSPYVRSIGKFSEMIAGTQSSSFVDLSGNNGFLGYFDDGVDDFACFVWKPTDSYSRDRSLDHWQDSIRLVPSYPKVGGVLFFPIGWKWIDFDR